MLLFKDPRGVLLRWLRVAAWAGRVALAFLVSPAMLCLYLLAAGCGLLVVGVRINFGDGWALIVGAAPLLAGAFILLRGLARA